MAEVIAANDIVEVVGSVLDLKGSGTGRFVALCPFHQEKTPSFHVNRDRQMFHCFGCNKSGDVLDFVREHEGLSFVEALERLANRAGVALPRLSRSQDGQDDQRGELLKLAKFAARFFRENLRDPLKGGKGRAYVKSRTLGEATVTEFGLGYAPEGWNALTDVAHAEGFHENVLVASGLAKKGERGTVYDFFRNRLMFPIRDTAGNVMAFGGRDLSGEAPGKYVNSRENAAYKKSRVLYGLFEARDALRREGRAILVEGYFDLLRCADAGIRHVVATCGTALTPDQAKLIRRYVPEVVVVFDGDEAGLRAALRGVSVLTAAGLSVRALALPEGQDPDDFVLASGGDAFRRLVEHAPDFVTFYVQVSSNRLTTIEGRTAVAREIFTILTGMSDVLRRDEYLKRMAKELQLSEWAVQSEFTKVVQKGKPAPQPDRPDEHAAPVAQVSRDDEEFVAALIRNEPLRDEVRRALASFALRPGPLAAVLGHIFEDTVCSTNDRIENEQARALYASAANWDGPLRKELDLLVRKRLARLKRESLEAEAARIQEELRQAEQRKDTPRMLELLQQKVGIEREIQSLDAA